MKTIIVDTNIVFSALRIQNHSFRKILERSDLKFYAPNFLAVEIFKHKNRILEKSSLTEDETIEVLTRIFSKIILVNEDQISTSNFIGAYRLCKEIDEKDAPFVALALEFNAELWTRDEELKQHLKQKGFNSFFSE